MFGCGTAMFACFVELLFGVAIADSSVLAGVCQNFRAIDGDGNLPDFQDTALRGHFQNLGKCSVEELAVISPECANGVMVGMGIRTHKAHGHIGVAGALDLPAGKHSRAVGINQKRQKHGWRILLTAGAPMIDLSHGNQRAAGKGRASRFHATSRWIDDSR